MIEEINGKIYDVWSYWKTLPIDYCCPVCGREKKHIVRPNRHGNIMMHITSKGICEDCIDFRTQMRKKYGNPDMSADDAILKAYVESNQMHREDI